LTAGEAQVGGRSAARAGGVSVGVVGVGAHDAGGVQQTGGRARASVSR
jgi:hypothetical protein